MDIWDRFCVSYPPLLTIKRPVAEKRDGSRILIFSRDTLSLRIEIDIMMLGRGKIPLYWRFTQNGIIIPGELCSDDGDLLDSKFVIVLYDIMKKYFLLIQ